MIGYLLKFGIYNHPVSSHRPKEIECFSCGTKGQMIVNGFIQSFYISYIPLIPFWAWQEVCCVSCRAELKFSEMGPELKTKYKPFRPIPIPRPWHFTGLLIILGIVLWVQYGKAKEQEIILQRAKNLEINRVIEYRAGHGVYTSMKVFGFEEDFILVHHNQYQVQTPEEINRILEAKNYTIDTAYLHRDTLIKMIANKQVFGIYW
ncbi:MAG: hypothetical protein AAFN10_06590 [Bacteroidota bacterium]